MLEKLLQAAIITFLLHLIAGLNSHAAVSSQIPPSLGTTSHPIVSSVTRFLQ
jgi:hypothetical protein